MLKRRRKIQKYINHLKLKKKGISKEDVEALKLQQQELEVKTQNTFKNDRGVSIPKLNFKQMQNQQDQTEPKWQDDDQQLFIQKKNKFKKLQLQDNTTTKQYQQKLKTFYNSRRIVKNWATVGQGEYQQDINDLIDQQQIYCLKPQQKRGDIQIQYLGRSTQKHNSVITGFDFKGQIAASCGLDNKLKLWSIKRDQSNPQLRIKLQKDVYTQGYPLNNCYFRGHQVLLGTLRQNLISIDCQKWKINRISSSFLNVHKNFQHIRVSSDRSQSLIFSQNKISILDNYNSYQGNLIASQYLQDVQFANNNKIFGISKDCLFEWDSRMWRMVQNLRINNSFTRLWANENTLAIGNKLGIVTLYTSTPELKQYGQVSSLVTHITDLKADPSGNLMIECSKWKGNAARVIDIHKGKCIGGWPTTRTKIGMATVAGFSGTGQFGVGNSHGVLNFYSLKTL